MYARYVGYTISSHITLINQLDMESATCLLHIIIRPGQADNVLNIHLIFILGTICHDKDALRDVFVLSPYLLNSLS